MDYVLFFFSSLSYFYYFFHEIYLKIDDFTTFDSFFLLFVIVDATTTVEATKQKIYVYCNLFYLSICTLPHYINHLIIYWLYSLYIRCLPYTRGWMNPYRFFAVTEFVNFKETLKEIK